MNALRYLPINCLMLAACEAPSNADGSAPEAASQSPAKTASATAASAPSASAREIEVSDDLIEFSYTYPANASAIPPLAAFLDADAEKSRAEVTARAGEMRDDAKEGGFPFRPFGYWVEWQTVTDLPGWLSLSATVSTYEGGAHPNHNFATILWDKQAAIRLEPAELFTSREALSAAIRAPFCRKLDKERAEKRGGDGKIGGGIGEFDACIDPLDNGTLILGSSNRKTFDRLGVLVPPYNAGPYAEGSYEVTLPVTETILNTVRPLYRSDFTVKR
ncbi:MAG: DUF4163 domain-containing protein [Novosphingobium sp.]|nr:DUF4163 domain-containing protein [Novosphingobium sp.]